MTAVAYAAIAVAALWILSLVTLALEFSGMRTFGYISTGLSIAAAIGMMYMVVAVSRAGDAQASGLASLGLIAGVVGSLVHVFASLLVLVGFRPFDELVGWVLGGLGVFAIWLILINIAAPDAMQLTNMLRWLGIAVGIGFILLTISAAFIGVYDPTADAAPTGIMGILQTVGGGLAYIGFPVWLVAVGWRLL